jgi:hypothetical protein
LNDDDHAEGVLEMSTRRGGIPGPESRTGLVRPTMTEAEFERRQGGDSVDYTSSSESHSNGNGTALAVAPVSAPTTGTRTRTPRAKPTKPRRVQRMFAIEEELDKKLWLYAIHVGKDRSDVVNDLLRPLVQSMVLYDSRDRRSVRSAEVPSEEQGTAAGE